MKLVATCLPRSSLTARSLAFAAAVGRPRHLAGLMLVVAVATGIGLAGRGDRGATVPGRGGAEPMPVQCVEVEPVDSIDIFRAYAGVIQSARSSDLSFPNAGKLVKVLVREGDRVRAQQPLAKLDTRHLMARRQELQARSAEAIALLDEYRSGPRQEVIAAARADVEDMRSQLELSQLKERRRQQLRDRKAISQEDLDETSYNMRSVAARLQAAQRRLEELLAGTRPERISAQEAVVAQLDAELLDLSIDVEDSTLVAPFDGAISQRYVDEGTVVAPATPIVQIVEDGAVEAWIGIPARLVASVVAVPRHDVTVEGSHYPARLRAVLPELDLATRTRTVIFTLDRSTADAEVFAGQVARVQLKEQIETRGFWLPTAALTRGRRGLWSALVVQPDQPTGGETVKPRDVEVLYTEGEDSLVRGVLTRGDRVVAAGTHRIVPGQLVTVTSTTFSQRLSSNKRPPRK